jgi:hypothetical protein
VAFFDDDMMSAFVVLKESSVLLLRTCPFVWMVVCCRHKMAFYGERVSGVMWYLAVELRSSFQLESFPQLSGLSVVASPGIPHFFRMNVLMFQHPSLQKLFCCRLFQPCHRCHMRLLSIFSLFGRCSIFSGRLVSSKFTCGGGAGLSSSDALS